MKAAIVLLLVALSILPALMVIRARMSRGAPPPARREEGDPPPL